MCTCRSSSIWTVSESKPTGCLKRDSRLSDIAYHQFNKVTYQMSFLHTSYHTVYSILLHVYAPWGFHFSVASWSLILIQFFDYDAFLVWFNENNLILTSNMQFGLIYYLNNKKVGWFPSNFRSNTPNFRFFRFSKLGPHKAYLIVVELILYCYLFLSQTTVRQCYSWH